MGPAQPDGFDAGERVGVPSLRALGVRRLDAAVVSHGANDLAGGFEAVRRAYPMPVAYAPDGARLAGNRTCLAGLQLQWVGAHFLFPPPPAHFPYPYSKSRLPLSHKTHPASPTFPHN